ncbi:MAG: DUF2071 domain-containing protein [Gemmatimonadaceae bacterium]|nr:DUF2071 domain-containing protein [Gemmatimonadaceae bacterium]
MTRPFLTAEWRHLLMVNWRVPPAVLAPLVPRGTELDCWDGSPWASIVAFRFLRTRLLGVPLPGYRDFDEVNLRFYVRRREGREWRRAAVFVRELVPHRAIAWVAQLAYNEPYRALPMRSTIVSQGAGGALTFAWRRNGQWESVGARVDAAPQPCDPASNAAFITEHYWGYTRQRDGGTIEYQVAHPPWRVAPARDVTITADIASLYGSAFADIMAQAPDSAFVAEGSAVTVYRPRRVG